MRTRDEHAEPAIERIGGDPRFMRACGVSAARDHGRLDPLAAVTGDTSEREQRERHTGYCSGLRRRRPDAGHQPVQIRSGTRVAFPWCPRGKVLVSRRRVRAGLDLKADNMVGQYGDGVPDAGLNVDAKRIAAQGVGAGDLPCVIEGEKCQLALQHQERLRLRRVAVPMRGDVRTLDHHIEESMGVVLHAGVEIVVGPQARRLARALNQREEEGRVDYLHG